MAEHARAIPVLMYHHVSPEPGLVTVSPECFAQQMAALAQAGWNSLTASEFAAFLAGEKVPAKSLLITFDDGYLDNWVYAHPVLARHALCAVEFIVTEWIKEGPTRPNAGEGGALPATPDHQTCKSRIAAGQSDEVILRWSEIKAMQDAGTFEFHSHTHSHRRWDKECPDNISKSSALSADLEQAVSVFRDKLHQPASHLCWPQGFYDADYIRVAQDSGFTHLYTTIAGINVPGTDTRLIKRLVVKEKPASWLLSRLEIYRRPWLGRIYSRLKG